MNSLFSFIAALYAVVLLYFPSTLSRLLLSPVPLSTLILLLYLLRLGAAQRSRVERFDSDSVELINSEQSSPPHQIEEFRDVRDSGEHCRSYESDPKKDPIQLQPDPFVEWDVRAPLEVIHEEYEGEDDAGEKGGDSEAAKRRESQANDIRRYASLSLFYPESDSEASSEGDYPAGRGWDSPESGCFRWEEEDEDREGLIEIALDEKGDCEAEEENLIEIDLSPAR